MEQVGRRLLNWEVFGDEEKYDTLVKLFKNGEGEYRPFRSLLIKGERDPAISGKGFIISTIKAIKVISVKSPVWTPEGNYIEMVILIKTYHGDSYLLSSRDFSRHFAKMLSLYGLGRQYLP